MGRRFVDCCRSLCVFVSEVPLRIETPVFQCKVAIALNDQMFLDSQKSTNICVVHIDDEFLI